MTGFAKQQIRETARYIYVEFGKQSKDDFILKLNQTKQLLEINPCLGPVEPLLSDLSSNYRSIVIGHLNKMIYRILEDHIEISDFWDVRRAPKSLVEQLK